MKWFKHETDAHTNLKLQRLFDHFSGVEAYGYYWICVELVALQGQNFRVKAEKNWKNYVKKMINLEVAKQEEYLTVFEEIGLIDKKANKRGDLFIPKLAERSDDYTKRVRRVYEHSTNNVHLEQKRTDKIRKEKTEPEPIIKTLRQKYGTSRIK